jgi:hypothetical protein
MAYITTAAIVGKSRSDGTTDRTITMNRVGSVTNGFVLRESLASAPDQRFAQQLTHRSFEVVGKGGEVTRHSNTSISWPFEKVPGDGILAGTAYLNKTGLHIPVSCPPNVRADIFRQLTSIVSSSAGTVGEACIYKPLISGEYPA